MKNRAKSLSEDAHELVKSPSKLKQADISVKLTLKRRAQSAKPKPGTPTVRRRSFLERANLLAQSNKYFKEHSALTLGPTKSLGESDAFFKRTLRNYKDLSLVTSPPPSLARSRRSRSEKKKKENEKGDCAQKFFSASESSLTSPHLKNTASRGVSEEDSDVFYSPDRLDLYCGGDLEALQLSKLNQELQELKQEKVKNTDLETVKEQEEVSSTTMAESAEKVAEAEGGQEAAEHEGDSATLVPTEEHHSGTDKKQQKHETDEEIPSDERTVLREVEECEAQCMEIYKILSELKRRVSELLSKAERTPDENRELEEKQKELNDKMAMLEQKTRRIELLVGRTKKPTFNKVYDEDALPKVVVCGLAENNMPKFIICDDKKRRQARKAACSPLTGSSKLCPNANLPPQPFAAACSGGPRRGPPPAMMDPCPPCCAPGLSPQMGQVTMSAAPQFVKRLSDSYDMQERLAKENADLESKRYQLQEDLLSREQMLESVQRQLQCMQQELRQVVKENGLLNCKLQQIQEKKDTKLCPATSGGSCPPKPCGPGKGPCPADDETRKLEKQLTLMEMEVKAIQNELTTVRQERLHLEQHRRMLSPMTCPPPCGQPCMPPRNDAQLREMREKYNCLQDDYKSKLTEVAGLRADVDKFKNALQESAEGKKSLEAKIRELEKMMGQFRDPKSGSFTKESFMEMEQQLQVAKQRFREAQDELDELRALAEEQQNQLGDYRNKYLDAQQQVEEQRRQMDLMELENNRIGEQVNLEIQRVKNQFQEKLQELTPLPDILKATQLKMQEAQQMHLLAERNNEALLREIQNLRDKAVMAVEQMQANQVGMGNLDADRQSLQEANEEYEKQIQLMQAENDDLRNEVDRMHSEVDDAEKRAQEKLHEIAQLSAEVENVREESARQVARVKDRCETIRRSMQNQVCDLEKQLVQSRAQAKSAQRDRDDIRQKMQCQINNLNENFDDAQMRIRTLQGHVNFLKNSAVAYPGLDQTATNRNC